MKKNLLLLFIFLSLFPISTFTIDESHDEAETRNLCFGNDCDDLCNSLALKDLCAKKIRAKQGLFREICAERIKSESICTRNLGVENVAIANVCATDINTTTLCVTGTARINEVCGLYRASVQLTGNFPYVLGDPINFDQIIDDPNGNVAVGPFSYTIPVSGYYIASVEVDANNFAGTNLILGTPIAKLNLKVNGVDRRKALTPFLTFNDTQQTDLSFLLFVSAGDKITVDYQVLVVDQVLGTIPYVGTATLLGGNNSTIFKIHYLSSTCTPSASCESCSFLPVPCTTECIPLPNSCIHRP